MTTFAVLTASYAPDFELCRDLRTSIVEHLPSDTVHHLVTPARDVARFSQLKDERCVVRSATDLLPSWVVGVPRANAWVNLRRPFPPIRGWVMQQVLKLAAAASLDADAVLLADSDLVFVRSVGPQDFVQDGTVRLYRRPHAVHAGMPKHLRWHAAARKLLGLPPAEEPPLHDYVMSPNCWDPDIVRKLLAHIEQVTGRHWVDAVASQLQVSECILYGVFVDEVLGAPANAFGSESTRCHVYWEPSPLDAGAALAFVETIRPDDLAVLIQSKSRTSLDVRRAALATVARSA